MRFLTSLQEEMDVIARNLICVGRFIDRDHLRDLNTILARIFIKVSLSLHTIALFAN